MAWSVLQSASFNSTTGVTSATATFGTNLSSGSKLIVYVGYGSGGGLVINSVSDGTNGFTQVKTGGLSAFLLADVWVLDTPAGDVGTKPTITVTPSSSCALGFIVQEVTGLASGTSGSLDGTPGLADSASGASSPTTSPTYSSAASNEYLVSLYVDGYAAGGTPHWAVPAGYTADANSIQNNGVANVAVGYKNSSNGSESAAWSFTVATTEAWTVILGAFKLAAAGGGPAGTVQPRATVPVPRRRPARAVQGGVRGPAFIAVAAPVQQFRTAPRRVLARAVVRGSVPFTGYVAVAAPHQPPYLPPRRRPARAVIQFTPVTTTNAAAVAGTPGTQPVLIATPVNMIVRRTGRISRF